MVSQTKKIERLEALNVLKPLSKIETLYRAFDLAEAELTRCIGVPICKEHCGKCCEVTTPDVWEIEARFLVSAIIGSTSKIEDIANICESWLLEKNPAFKTVFPIGKQLSNEQWKKIQPELNLILQNSPCPFLTSEKACLIHWARSLVCRAYGVTRMASPICPRPLSKMEAPDVRAHIGHSTELGKRIRAMLWNTLKEAESVGWGWTYFMPTILYMILKPDKFKAYVTDGRIATVKLLKLRTNTGIIFQDQLNEVWMNERIPSLCGIQ